MPTPTFTPEDFGLQGRLSTGHKVRAVRQGMEKLRVLIACEFSGTVRDAFLRRGYDAMSCDLLPTEVDGPHYQGDVRNLLVTGAWDLMIAHPPCTYLANSGVRHLHENVVSSRGNHAKVFGVARMEAMKEAAVFFVALKAAPIPRICIENPIPHKYAREIIGRYNQLIQPWQFGHGEVKATCLWLKGLPPLTPTQIVSGRYPRMHMLSPSPNRWKERSRTYKGIAEAMAAQWG